MSDLLLKAALNKKFQTDVQKYIKELESKVKHLDFFRAAQEKQLLPARESAEFFTQCIGELEKAFTDNINSYSGMRWMYYLRRTPNAIFSGDLSSTGVNSRVLAEVYANRSTKSETATYGSNGFVFPINDSTLRHVARFVSFITIIYDLQVGFRFASKGSEFDFSRQPHRALIKSKFIVGLPAFRSVLPRRVRHPLLEAAVQIYDQRHNYQRRTFQGVAMSLAGLAHDDAAAGDIKAHVDITQALWGMHDEIVFSPQEFLDGNSRAEIYGGNRQIIVRFSPSNIDYAKLFELYRLPVMEKVDIDNNAALCLLLIFLAGRWLQRQRYSFLRVMELGYFIMEFQQWENFADEQYSKACDEIRQYLPQFQAPENYSAFVASCLNFKGEVWPLSHGDILRITNDYVCIDMWAASTGFLGWFQFPKTQGQVANERAAKFEDVVQEVIDFSPWADSSIRGLRQRELKVDGQALTDIDAIGSYDGTLLVVSCKSIPYTREYDRGTHNVIRNAASTVDNGVVYWESIVSQLQARKVGDNFNLTSYKHVIGVVCTPFAVYTSHSASLSISVGDLRWACSLDELSEFLRSSASGGRANRPGLPDTI
ncbi:hypothetical protein [Ectopseudomonas alcaliphila]|uniref:Uncharacterized protein n=1 Tax=Ectopseudomonas alcaliphila TaxID=101564 RepID=A0A1G6U093_9GAMM|nr:hypothetical protein [Pseudomonas alcaliphila]MDX5991424.1 hypothetical protein [Pseudomonas alcaliphila]SDD34780.1 hypothetical protein SAMN05216575_101375 [Pseudomonas alcaliphila]